MATDWQKKYEQQRQEGFESCRAKVKEMMSASNIDVIVVSYSGSGDEGDIDDIHAFARVDADKDFPDLESGYINEDLVGFAPVKIEWGDWDDIAYEMANYFNPGYGNNEGGCGFFVINLLTGKITGEHGVHVVETNYDHSESEL